MGTKVEHDESETEANFAFLNDAVARADQVGLIGHIAHSLYRVALAQERLVALAEADLDESIEAAIEQRAEQKAKELDEEKTKRSFIGRR